MFKAISLLGLVMAIPFGFIIFAELLDLNAAVAASEEADSLFDSIPQIFMFAFFGAVITLIGGVIAWMFKNI